LQKPLLTWALVDPAAASRKPRPKLVAASTDATVLLVKVPRHLEGKWGGPRHTYKKLALMPQRMDFPRSFPRFFRCLVPGYLLGSAACGLTLPPLIARPHGILC
jgi:hypothetical protein